MNIITILFLTISIFKLSLLIGGIGTNMDKFFKAYMVITTILCIIVVVAMLILIPMNISTNSLMIGTLLGLTIAIIETFLYVTIKDKHKGKK